MWKIGLLSILLSMNVFGAQSLKGKCLYDLVGPQTLPDSILEPHPLTVKECTERARRLLKLNSDSYNKAVIKHSLKERPFVIENE